MIKPTVLIIEDNQEYQQLLQLGYERSQPGCRFEFFSSAEQVQQYLESPPFRPFIILLDYDLPGMNGLELLGQLKQSARFRHIPVLMFSMFTTTSLVDKAYEMGASAYLEKPSDLTSIQAFWLSLNMFWSHSAQLPRIND